MKKIESFEELRRLRKGAIVCLDLGKHAPKSYPAGTWGFAKKDEKNVTSTGVGDTWAAPDESDGVKVKSRKIKFVECFFKFRRHVGHRTVIYKCDFHEYDLRLLEPADVQALWDAIWEIGTSTKEAESFFPDNEILRYLLLKVMRIY